MPLRDCVVGIDGGASKTIAVIGDGKGEIAGVGKAGSTNYHNIGLRATVASIRKAIRYAAREARSARVRPKIAVCALAAMDSRADYLTMARVLKAAKIADKTFVTHDSVAALRIFFGDQAGIIVDSGAGSMAAGVNTKGEYARIGGWGYLFGDEGSGFDIGRRAVVAAFRASDGRSPHTQLEQVLRRKFRVKTLPEILPRMYAEKTDVDEIADLAITVSNLAPRDSVSRMILSEAGLELALHVYAAARRLGISRKRFGVATIGGNFKSKTLSTSFARSVRVRCPRARITKVSGEPAIGAYNIAVSLYKGERFNLRSEVYP